MTALSATVLFGLCAGLVLGATVPEANQAASQAQAPATMEAAESSYGSSYNSYSPKQYKSGYESSYDAPAPYVTGSCYGQYPGMFGNADYDCKSYRVCQADGRLDVLYCPPYTRFNNYLGVCDWHFKVDSYCNPIYKEEYNNNNYGYEAKGYSNYEKYPAAPAYPSNYGQESYAPKYEKSYEKPAYNQPIYNAGYETAKYSNYEAPVYESKAYEAPSYGHRSVYKKY